MLGQQIRQKKNIVIIFIAVILLILPLLFKANNMPFAANAIFLSVLYSIMSLAWNLLGGYCGHANYGNSVYFGVGAYTTIFLLVFQEITPWIGIFISGITGCLAGIFLGAPFFRLKSIWFALATSTSVLIFQLIFIVYAPEGSRGIQVPIVPPEKQLFYLRYAGPYIYIYIALAILAVELYIMNKVLNSKLGYYFQAIREDERAAMALGVHPFKYKMIAMVFNSFFVGMCGGLYAVRYRFVDPFAVFEPLTWSLYPVVTSLLGGTGFSLGPMVGSFLFMPFIEYIRAKIVPNFPRLYGLHFFTAGVILMFVSLRVPKGILGWLEQKGYIRRTLPSEVLGLKKNSDKND
jgi:branched-chain amino acid transport system permease protein